MIRYANVGGISLEPAPGLKGTCPGCGNAVVAKCGTIKIHHWAHERRIECDPWWEPMTQWHLDWQNLFPEQWREKVFRDEESGEFHRADICTSDGLTIEFQHSPISSKELESRNAFYKKIIWVVNARRFKGGFNLTSQTPNPESPLLAQYNFFVDKDGLAKFPQFFLREEYMFHGPLIRSYSLNDKEMVHIAQEQDGQQPVYYLFSWTYPHRSWLSCSSPVFLDFGGESLYWIKKRLQLGTPLIYLKTVSKIEFLAKYSKEATS